MVCERRLEPNVETRKVKVEVPPFAPEPWDSPGILPAAAVGSCSGINGFLYFSDQTSPVFWGNNQCQTQNPQVHPWAWRLGTSYHGNQLSPLLSEPSCASRPPL